jgi:hypothetical protein
MHGVLMQVFSDAGYANHHHPSDSAALKALISKLCQNESTMRAVYSPGDCAHGVGHALMFVSAYAIPAALTACREFGSQALNYYCATGAYMEYVTERDAEDARNKSLLYPCDTYEYPAACARHKMWHVVRRPDQAGKTIEDFHRQCRTLKGKFRLGCFHGLGNAYSEPIALGQITVRQVCLKLQPAEERLCIEGAMERMAKFYEQRALEVCNQLDGRNKKICLTSVRQKMYDMNKDLSLYVPR